MIRVMRDETGFKVFDGQQERQVNNYDVHPFLRKLTPEQVQKFEEVGGRIRASRMNNGDYNLTPQGGLNGGGPGLAWITYVAINAASAAGAAATAWCPPLATGIAIGGHIAATAAAIALSTTPTP